LLTGRAARPLDPSCGTHGPRLVAVVDEARCIGCRLCIDACPVDAIIGAPKRLHIVLPSLCSGCELCVAPCPVDCIAIVVADRPWTTADAADARERHRARGARLARGERIASRIEAPVSESADESSRRQATVAAALQRARARRAARAP
jgi:electron transport complex protein RnfB